MTDCNQSQLRYLKILTGYIFITSICDDRMDKNRPQERHVSCARGQLTFSGTYEVDIVGIFVLHLIKINKKKNLFALLAMITNLAA